jgi:hypothetical protein
MKKLFLAIVLTCASKFAFAAAEMNSQEMSCRAKAKEVAAEAYRGCVTDYKSAELERLKKSYQDRLKALKDNYEREIEQLSGKSKAGKNARLNGSRKKQRAEESPEVSNDASRATNDALTDDSRMDLPEPMPIEASPSSL